MDRYFYSVEMEYGRKVVHISGNVYYNDGDEAETCFRIASWTFLYITLKELRELLKDIDVFWEYLNERVAYIGDRTEEQAIDICRTYFNGKPGKRLDIRHVDKNTPCGDYWFE